MLKMSLVTAVVSVLVLGSVAVASEGGTAANASTVPLAQLPGGVLFGAAVADLPGGRVDLPALEAKLGSEVSVASAFVDWSYVPGANEVWMSDQGRRRVLLSWEPTGIRFSDISRGYQDGYLSKVAAAASRLPFDLWVRPWPEMNARWSAWQPTLSGSKPSGGTPTEFIAAWRHTVNFMRSHGAANVKFVFNPDSSDWASNTPIQSIWPGADYVDALGIDGYNWGQSASSPVDTGDRWREFAAIFQNMYTQLTTIDAEHPVWITEVASKEPEKEDDWKYPQESSPVDTAHGKGYWIKNMVASLAQMPRVVAIVWFDKKKERDWRLDSSPAALDGIRSQLSSSLVAVSSPTPTLSTSPSPSPSPSSARKRLHK